MKFGIVPREWGDFLQESVEQAVLANKLGYDSIWVEEHHGNELYLASPLIALAGLSQHVKNMQIGTAVVILPLYHPVRFASDAAVLDILSRGNFIAGIGTGYREEDFKVFGVPLSERAGRLNESIEIIKRLWENGEINYHGKYFQIEKFRLEPRPLQNPRPPIWVGGWVEKALERAAKLGDAWFPGPVGTISYIEQMLTKYKELLVKYGKTFNGFPLMREAHVAETDELAFENIKEPVRKMYGADYAKTSHPILGKKEMSIEEWVADRFIVGSPSSVIEQVERLRKLGVNHLVLRISLRKMSHQNIMKSIKLFGEKVMPHFKEKTT